MLFGADAFPCVVERSAKRLAGSGRLEVDAFKVCHHGSKANTSQALVDSLDAQSYLISSSGSRHSHPDRESIARLIWFGGKRPTLMFNYASDANRAWRDGLLRTTHGYIVKYPDSPPAGMVLELS